MPGLADTLEELAVTAIVGGKGLLPVRSKAAWVLIAVSVLLAGGGVFLLIVSLDRFFGEHYRPYIAALMSAAIVFVLAAGLVAAARFLRRRTEARDGAARIELGKNIRVLIDDICSELEEPVQENPKTAVALAALAGFLTANYQSARR
jgi:hypothetical protein